MERGNFDWELKWKYVINIIRKIWVFYLLYFDFNVFMIIIYLKWIWFIYLFSIEFFLYYYLLNLMFKGIIFFVWFFDENGRI